MREEIDARLEELRAAVEEARSMPMSASVMLNRAELLAMVDDLDTAITQGLATAASLMGDRDAVLAASQSEADEIVRLAGLEREKLVSDTDVYRLGSERAEELTAEAERNAEELRADTADYIESSLANFEHTLEKTLETVRRGRARLTEGHASGLSEDSRSTSADDAGELPELLQYRHRH